METSVHPAGSVVAARFFFLLGIAVWLGGLVLVAFGAPAMVHASFDITGSKAIGFQMVGVLMGAFTPVTYVCALLILIGWLAQRAVAIGAGRKRLWMVQGVSIGVMIVIAGYCGTVIMPRMNALQPQVISTFHKTPTAPGVGVTTASAKLPGAGKGEGSTVVGDLAIKKTFDAAHTTFRSLTSLVVLLCLANLTMFCIGLTPRLK